MSESLKMLLEALRADELLMGSVAVADEIGALLDYAADPHVGECPLCDEEV